MKPIDLIKILDSGVVRNLRIGYCGGHIDVNPKTAPFELPNYEIAKLWADDNGGIVALLADGIAAEMEPTPEKEQTKDEIPLFGIWKKCEYDDGGYNFECSECKQKYPDNPKHCPNCGKKMQNGDYEK